MKSQVARFHFSLMSLVSLAVGSVACDQTSDGGGPSLAHGGRGGDGGEAGQAGAGGHASSSGSSSSSSSSSSTSSSGSSSSTSSSGSGGMAGAGGAGGGGGMGGTGGIGGAAGAGGTGGSGGSGQCTDGQVMPCFTGDPATLGVGVCHAGTQTCLNGSYGACTGETTAINETCNGLDDDCNGAVDNGNPGSGMACSTGQPGICSAGTTTCQGGSIVCNANSSASTEVCDNIDNDCDGQVDNGNPGGGMACSTGQPGICSAGTTACQGGSIVCNANSSASTEVCDGFDNDCNGQVDNGNPGGGANCSTGQLGACSAGTTACQGGSIVCTPKLNASTEVCDGVDNDCDGQVDNGNPGGGMACSTGQPGACSTGTTAYQNGTILCNQNVTPTPEICDGIDNDCNGLVDEGNPGGGASCGPVLGACGQHVACINGALTCAGAFVGPAGVGASGNPGTPTQPLSTIAAAQARAQALGGNTNICLCDTTAAGPSIYSEMVTMIEGIGIYGGYNCADWSRDIATFVTTIQGTLYASTPTVTIPAGITAATSLDGLTVEGPVQVQPSSPLTYSTAISITDASPTLTNVTAHGKYANYSYGMKVTATAGNQASPTVTGGVYGGVGHGISGNGSRSYGVSVTGGSGTFTNISTTANGTADRSIGFDCVGCSSTIQGGFFDTAYSVLGGTGFQGTGNLNGLSVSNATMQGGYGGNAAERNISVFLSACTGSPTFTNVQMSGGTSVGSHYGLYVEGAQCSPIVSNSTIDGGVGATSLCYGIYGQNSAGLVVTNSTITGSKQLSHCIAGGVVCDGNCGTFNHNTIRAGTIDSTQPSGMGIYLAGNATPMFDDNDIAGPWCPSSAAPNPNAYLAAGYFFKSKATLTNNILHDEFCNNGPVDVLRIDKGIPAAIAISPIIQNNTILFSTCTGCTVKRGVTMNTADMMAAPAGILRNNIIANVGTSGFTNAYGVYEMRPASAIELLQNNDIWVPNGGILYFTGGTTALTLAAANALLGSSANISADPLLDATFHLQAASPCRNAGTMTGAPAFDFDGDARPQEMSYDIGADEYVP